MVVGMIFFTIGNSCVWISITYTNRTLDLDLKLGQMADRNLNLHYPLSTIRYPLSTIRYPNNSKILRLSCLRETGLVI
jgi:hypothetical protein